MAGRHDVLKPFEQNKSYMEEKIQRGIELYRKGVAILEILDQKGQPAQGATVSIRQRTHDFQFGANCFMLDEFQEPTSNNAYGTYFKDLFNLATLPFYWRDLEPEQDKPRYDRDSPKIYRRPAPDLCLEFCEANHITPKAHCLNYAAMMPDWACGDVGKEKRLLEKHFRELGERYASRIRDWEVVNESFWGVNLPRASSFYYEDDFIDWNFAVAQKYFKRNRLLINEASGIWDNAQFFGNRSPYYMLIERALNHGARVDAIGLQFHMFIKAEREAEETKHFYDPKRLYDVMDLYAKLCPSLQITEITIPAYSELEEDEELQAEIIRNLYSIWFSHPAMEAIVYWNLVDGFAYKAEKGEMNTGENYYRGGLIRHDFSLKPAYKTLKQLIHDQWHTELLQIVKDNPMSFKGFYGEYDVIIEQNGRSITKSLHLTKHGDNHFVLKI